MFSAYVGSTGQPGAAGYSAELPKRLQMGFTVYVPDGSALFSEPCLITRGNGRESRRPGFLSV
jgi:hypothetical protein